MLHAYRKGFHIVKRVLNRHGVDGIVLPKPVVPPEYSQGGGVIGNLQVAHPHQKSTSEHQEIHHAAAVCGLKL